MRLECSALFLLAASLCGCSASPEIVAERSPDPAGTGYRHVLVYAEAPDREWRESLESLLSKELSAFGIAAVPAFTLADGLSGQSATDAVIVIAVSDTGMREEWVQPQSGVGTISSNALVSFSGSGMGSTGGSSPAQCKTRALSGAGYNATTPWAVIAVTVVDRATREPVWRSATEFEGEANSDFENLRRAYARSIATKMDKDDLW